jgi:hypothetical protein
MHRPEIVVERYAWDDTLAAFTSTTVGCYRHNSTGWSRIASCN